MLDRALTHLKALVAADSRNPPRAITASHAAILHSSEALESCGFDVRIDDLGDGSVNLLAVRGWPKHLVNCHLDTVPDDPGWSADPWTLRVENNRAIGLGACDIKGAAACQLAAAESTQGAMAILFSTDEEAGPSRCVRAYLTDPIKSVECVVVSEPTGGKAVTEHRGLATCEIEFKGSSGHSSSRDGRNDSALHHAVQWSSKALEHFHSEAAHDDHRFNIGVIRGGSKSNMIASSAIVNFGVRPPASVLNADCLAQLRNMIPSSARADWRPRFDAPALPHHEASAACARELGIETSPPVDYWTEAALFAEANLPTFVFGPGHIEQAHTADEFVSLDQLSFALDKYRELFSLNAS